MAGLVERYGTWALVAGASEGMGAAFAEELAAAGMSVVLVARRADKLEAFAEALAARHPVQVRTLALDLGHPDVLTHLADGLGDLDVGLMVYNACASFIGEFLDLTIAQKQATIDVNVRGATLLTTFFGERMVARGRGAMILLSSLSCFQGSAMVGIYAATKAFDLILGEVLWEELGPKGVDVLVCVAGATLTPNFMDQTPERKRATAMPMVPEDVARGALAALGRKGPTWIPGFVNRMVQGVLQRCVPRRTAVRFISGNTRKMYDPGRDR
ncbi:MAG: SDR family NAD(P)-dependent oxidoreductase [Alphaproteobacteria bacterium]|nr:SDR family NAD(P)-dependent oxidoreductase [Alphaproteobacteria bacterium]